MPDGMTTASIRWALVRLKEKLDSSASELNELDAALGDGDLGATMARAGEALVVDLPSLPEDVGMALFRCAQTFGRVSAGTFGTLIATGLMAAAKATKGRNTVPWIEVSSLLGMARNAMSERGKGQLGDKTVLDAIEAARLATEGLDRSADLIAAADRAVNGAIHQFRDLVFRQGRARIFGSKGIGRDDPGMIAFKRIVESLAGAPSESCRT